MGIEMIRPDHRGLVAPGNPDQGGRVARPARLPSYPKNSIYL
jgi:hypothetical protein